MKRKRPKYCGPHNPSGLGYVWDNGKQVYFRGSPHGSAESLRQYDAWCQRNISAEPLENPKIPGLVKRYLEFAEVHYGHTKEWSHLKRIGLQLAEEFPAARSNDFGPLKLQGFRQRLINAELSRKYVNDQIHRVKRIFKWGVSQELVRPDVLTALESVDGLRAGKTTAKESKQVLPANPAHVSQAKRVASPTIAAAITLLECTGMRASNLCGLRLQEIDRSGDIWVYCPGQHKSTHRGRTLAIPIGARGQEAIRSLPGKRPEEWILSPRDSCYWHSEQRGTRNPKVSPTINDKYNSGSLRQAIHYACDKARVPRFNPHQLRHSVSTTITAKHGIEAARLYLGHANVKITQLYAERDLAAAIELARHIG